MYYVVLAGCLLLFVGFVLFIKFKFPKYEKLIIERIFVIFLIVIFIFRFFSLNQIQLTNYDSFALWNGPMNGFYNAIGELCSWFEVTAALMIFLRPFSHFKTAKFYVKWIATPILIVSAISLYPTLLMLQGNAEWSLISILLPIEIAGLLSMCVYYWIKDYKIKISKHSFAEVISFSILINLVTLMPYIPVFVLGWANPSWRIYDFSLQHRIYLYLAVIIIPLIIYFALRNAHRDKIHYTLVFISLGTLLNFCSYWNFNSIFQFVGCDGAVVTLNNLFWYLGSGNTVTFTFAAWNLPLHLCNLAMFLIAICYVFRLKRLFYFTYFINVFGALLAMLMPNVGETLNIFNPSVIYFWINHAVAFGMPILGVALHEFERPKMKQYFYATLVFLVYYILVLFLNAYFSAIGHPTDFFFINSLFIADKLGQWAKNIFNWTITFQINGITFTMHPAYQTIYFAVYVLLGFAVWFVYQLGYDIADSHYDLMITLRGIKQDRLALKSSLNGRSLDEPMDKDAGIKYELKHFSKKYAMNKYYAVHDANLEVFGGEIFGFLGPNGAGKSTIIKSTVGIQPISEGSIEICGFDVAKQPVRAKSLIGFVPDHYALYEKLTGREYLNYIADIYEVSKEDRESRISKYVHLFELESSIDNKIKTYSHGMKQKVTIMAALIHNPKVWILDEPLTGLDPTSIFQVKECMRQHAAEGNIVFFSSHIIDIVEKLCNRIAIIKKGQIQCVKTLEEIESTGQTLEEFYLKTIGDISTLEKESKGKNGKKQK